MVKCGGADRPVRMVQEAQSSKVPVQALVDRIAAIFVPTIIAIALLSLGVWLLCSPTDGLTHGMVALVSVLVIACTLTGAPPPMRTLPT